MKKSVLMALAIGVVLSFSACSSVAPETVIPGKTTYDDIKTDAVDNEDNEPSEAVVGDSWRTWDYFTDIAWFTPEGEENICARIMTEPAGMIINKDTDSYNEICKITFHGSEILDKDYIYDTLRCSDADYDGYGDLFIFTKEDEGVYRNVYLWNPETEEFVANDNMSGFLTIEDKIAEYYMNENKPAGNYVVFDSENVETDETIEYIVRYQPSEEEEEEMIENGTGPLANIYVVTVTLNKATNEFTDEFGEILNIEL